MRIAQTELLVGVQTDDVRVTQTELLVGVQGSVRFAQSELLVAYGEIPGRVAQTELLVGIQTDDAQLAQTELLVAYRVPTSRRVVEIQAIDDFPRIIVGAGTPILELKVGPELNHEVSSFEVRPKPDEEAI